MSEIKIDIKDVEFIMGDDYANHFDKIVNSGFRTKCEGSFGNKSTKIVFYETRAVEKCHVGAKNIIHHAAHLS